MRLKFVLGLLMLGSTMLPLAMFWAWPHSAVLENEYDEVYERHLLLAQNLGTALERYHRDLTATFEFISAELIEKGEFANGDLMANLAQIIHSFRELFAGRT